MGTTEKPLVIKKPSKKVLELAREMERRKDEAQKRLTAKMDFFFPPKEKQK